ncbi:sulfurtransferase-like selenium metabolism protein YedF [Carboxylicivirga linearis]|uniref:Sulfurtransferase-like selenium metabolism protein YedF n=1 Tax=Carboxylicivirga linearis TaxID=1628157 RepID=A0ABS5JRE4_9BACT|nr:sulfurtransferase-like selenium metabolism protein YedF [Carboxylicivirga linearis]MBS2097461.1 sulfurtransferase-like selenium metabolism protein YedF [Carboxylicivirga linearis]
MKPLCELLQITRYGMGDGDEELGIKLIANYLRLLDEDSRLPSFIALYNGGVKLLAQNSPVIEQMKKLEERGVKIIACGTCLNYYSIADNIQVGIKGTMMDIITLQTNADKVINL